MKGISELEVIFPHESEHSLLDICDNSIKGVGDCKKIERKALECVFMYEAFLRNKSITREQSSGVIQILLGNGYLTMSDDNPNPKTELYFELTDKARKIIR
jgi:hypothetical protein